MIEIARLPPERWEEYRDLRLDALKSDPSAFGSSFEEERELREEEWRRRIENVWFALSDEKPVGMIGCIFNQRQKSKHVADIVGVYVRPNYRGKGIGTRLFDQTMSDIRKTKGIVKVKLGVNPEQKSAVRLYERAGFVVTGRERKELKVGRRYVDMLLMEKLL